MEKYKEKEEGKEQSVHKHLEVLGQFQGKTAP